MRALFVFNQPANFCTAATSFDASRICATSASGYSAMGPVRLSRAASAALGFAAGAGAAAAFVCGAAGGAAGVSRW